MKSRVALAGVLAGALACDRPERPVAPVDPPVRATPPPTSDPEVPAPAALPPAAGGGGWQSIPSDRLCVTSGSVAPLGMTRFAIDAPTFRAVTASATDARAELRFTYLGPTSTTRALGSGDTRRQLGLKLRAQDACNLIYVMWRFEPDEKLVVSIKRNPGQRTSAECGNRGYRNIKPRVTGPLPPIAPNARHVLHAELNGDALRVLVDDVPVWEGSLGPEAMTLEGPIGVRTDNVHIEAELTGAEAGAPRACRSGDDGE